MVEKFLLSLFLLVVGTLNVSAQSIFQDGFEPLKCPPPPTGYFEQRFTGNRPLTWQDAFYGAVFPFGKSHLSPIGSFTFRANQPSTRGPSIMGKYLVIPFTPEVFSNYNISWVGPQAIPAAGYLSPRNNTGVFVTISACKADFRPRQNGTNVPVELSARCRGFARNGNLFFGTTGGVGQCPVTVGKEHYINIVFANPADGLLPNETSCTDGTRCEGNFDGL